MRITRLWQVGHINQKSSNIDHSAVAAHLSRVKVYINSVVDRMKDSSQPAARTFALVYRGAAGDVRLGHDAHVEYVKVLQLAEEADEIAVKRKAHIERYFREFCDNVDVQRRLSQEKFKKEGNFPDGHHGKVAIWVFKSWQWRLYGATLTVEGRRCFVGMKIDDAKKQDRANQTMLKNTALEIGELFEYRPRT